MRKHLTSAGHLLFAWYGLLRYGLWYRRLCIIAVSGTDGKSSSVIMLAHMLRTAGHRTAHFSSISFHDGEVETANNMKMTTPGRAKLHAFLARATHKGCTHAVIEVTSEGIRQFRHVGIPLDLILYTNITPEHIERHGSFERYAHAKLSLMRNLRSVSCGTLSGTGTVVWNAADPTLRASVSSCSVHAVAYGSEVVVPSMTDEQAVGVSRGPFHSLNILAAQAASTQLGSTHADSVQALRTLPLIPGRYEVVCTKPTVIVDYAHTVHAVEMCLSYTRERAKGRLIHVFGAAGGGRDTWKRPLLAQLSERFADVHILTEENSFDENVRDIISDIRSGFSSDADVYVHPVREDAVRAALAMARDEDTVLCTAKGSEEVIAGPHRSLRPYVERAFIRSCLLEKVS